MVRFDTDPNVVQWGSEETIIPYKSPKDNRYHRYFVDFTIKIKDIEGKVQTILIEVKPAHETISPVLKEGMSAKSKKYINQVITYGVNKAKWEATKEYCKDRKWQFIIMTEYELGLAKR